MCVCTSVFVKIRCYADLVFSKYESDWDKIRIFSTPKVLRFAEILQQFQPPDQCLKNTNKDNNKATINANVCNDNIRDSNENNSGINENKRNIDDEQTVNINENSLETENRINENSLKDGVDTSVNENISASKDIEEVTNTEDTKSKTNKMLEAIEKCDFISLSNKIEDKVNIIELNLKEINLNEGCNENIDNIETKDKTDNDNTNEIGNKRMNNMIVNSQNKINENTINDSENKVNDKGQFPRRPGHRTRGRGRVQRSNAARAQQLQQNPDALCGIVFMKEALMAKIMFMLIVVSFMLSTLIFFLFNCILFTILPF